MDRLQREDGVTAEVEEVIVRADGGDVQQFPPDRGHPFGTRRRG
jgi:hypothetical protein